MKTLRSLSLTPLAIVLGLCPIIAHADDIVTNGSFGTGNLSGWTVSTPDGTSGVQTSPTDGTTYAFFGFNNSGFGSLSQNLATVAGTEYDISFDTETSVPADNQLKYQIGSSSAITIDSTNSWTQTTGEFIATGSSTDLDLLFSTVGGSGVWDIDNVSVTESATQPASVPDGGMTVALLGAGIIGLLAIRRKPIGA